MPKARRSQHLGLLCQSQPKNETTLLLIMEKVLVVWIEVQNSHNVPIGRSVTQIMALTLQFKERSYLHNSDAQGEAASADTEATASHPADLAAIMNESVYTKQQIFSVDETAFFWRKRPSRTLIATEEKSMPDFKASKDRLTLLLGANPAGDLKMKPVLIYYSENPRVLRSYAKLILPVLYKWNNKGWMTAHLLTIRFTEYLKCTFVAQLIPLFIDLVSSHPRGLMEIHNEINVVFRPANTTFILQPIDQGYSSNGSIQSKLKTFWKGSVILDAIKNIIHGKSVNTNRNLKEVDSKLRNSCRCGRNSKRARIKSRGGRIKTELLQSHDKTLTDEKLLLSDEQRNSISLVDEAASGFGRNDSNSESPTVGKMLSNSLACYKEIAHERKSQLMWQTLLLPHFKKLPQPPQPSTTTTLITQQPSTSRQDPPPGKSLHWLKTR
ncbi:hypothetical protein FD755_005194 [Muntiacus reevesi]|uniref:DDE-1 domain-containing protein n=1 Tax=Muntiacus reevesi TaxID=9886 RepID=A0A5J5MTR8_MUNRE|nr:hypothetical protein FD755_005194 [Muntiacus reevesi]